MNSFSAENPNGNEAAAAENATSLDINFLQPVGLKSRENRERELLMQSIEAEVEENNKKDKSKSFTLGKNKSSEMLI